MTFKKLLNPAGLTFLTAVVYNLLSLAQSSSPRLVVITDDTRPKGPGFNYIKHSIFCCNRMLDGCSKITFYEARSRGLLQYVMIDTPSDVSSDLK